MKKKLVLFLLLLFPIQVFAYSNTLIVTGEPIGIEIHSNGVYIVDFYSNLNSSLKKGDKIISINQQKVESIEDLDQIVTDSGTYSIQIDRNQKIINEKLVVEKENNEIRTGLYIKDEVDGVGTLSYIDPETKIFASLGHEILETSSNSLFDLNRGSLYEVYDESIQKNRNGRIGEIRVNFTNHVLGSIESNQVNGIYGLYQETLPSDHLVEVAKKDEIKLGEAYLYLNMENQEKKYQINILDIDKNETVKNIYFEVTDDSLLSKE